MFLASTRIRAALAACVIAVVSVFTLAAAPEAGAQTPTISGAFPPAMPTLGGVRITIAGANFGGNGGAVTIQGREVAIAAGADWAPNRILVTIPAGDPGPAPIVVQPASGPGSDPLLGSFYNAPQLFALSPDFGPAAGGTVVTLTGSNFGTLSAVGSVRFGTTAVPMIPVSHGEVHAVAPPLPPGSQHAVSLEINGQVSNSQTWTVLLPMINSFTPSSGPTTGAVPITIMGENFGQAPDPDPVVKFGGIIAPGAVRVSQGEIHVPLPAGAGANEALLVQVGPVESPPSVQRFSYDPPVINSLDPVAGAAVGGIRLTLQGLNFGPPGTARELSLQPLGGGFTVHPPLEGDGDHDRLEAILPPMAPGNYAVIVDVEGQLSNLRVYEVDSPPVIDGVLPASAPTLPMVGGDVLTIHGSGFGVSSGVVRVQGRDVVPQNVLEWTQYQIRCYIPEGDPGPAPIEVRPTFGPESLPSGDFAYEPPVILDGPFLVPAAGGVPITIFGRNFGTESATRVARMGGKIALCNRLNHHELEVVPPSLAPGLMTMLELEINGIAAPPVPVEVRLPGISAIEPPIGPTMGGIPLTIVGISFGTSPEDPDPVVTVGGQAATDVVRESDGRIVCRLPEGAGAVVPLEVLVGSASSGPEAFGYLPPTLDSSSPTSGPAAGGFPITIHGANFGPEGRRGTIALFDALGGGIPVPLNLAASSFTQLVGMLPPVPPGSYTLRVTVDGQVSNDLAYEAALDPPVISSVTPGSGPTQGNLPITIVGQNFGDATGTVRIGLEIATDPQWSANQIVCLTPAAWSGAFPVIVERAPDPVGGGGGSGGGGSGGGADFMYDPPQINGVFPNPLNPAGGQVITIVGQNFGREDAPRVVFIGGQPVMPLAWLGHQQITVLSPPGTAGTLASLCMVIDDAIATCTQVEYGSPVDVTPVHVPAVFNLRLAGANPSRGDAAFAIDLPREARWRLRIFDPAGRVVRAYEADAAAGVSTVRWDGTDARGMRARAGLYWARLEVAGETFVRKVVRL